MFGESLLKKLVPFGSKSSENTVTEKTSAEKINSLASSNIFSESTVLSVNNFTTGVTEATTALRAFTSALFNAASALSNKSKNSKNQSAIGGGFGSSSLGYPGIPMTQQPELKGAGNDNLKEYKNLRSYLETGLKGGFKTFAKDVSDTIGDVLGNFTKELLLIQPANANRYLNDKKALELNLGYLGRKDSVSAATEANSVANAVRQVTKEMGASAEERVDITRIMSLMPQEYYKSMGMNSSAEAAESFARSYIGLKEISPDTDLLGLLTDISMNNLTASDLMEKDPNNLMYNALYSGKYGQITPGNIGNNFAIVQRALEDIEQVSGGFSNVADRNLGRQVNKFLNRMFDPENGTFAFVKQIDINGESTTLLTQLSSALESFLNFLTKLTAGILGISLTGEEDPTVQLARVFQGLSKFFDSFTGEGFDLTAISNGFKALTDALKKLADPKVIALASSLIGATGSPLLRAASLTYDTTQAGPLGFGSNLAMQGAMFTGGGTGRLLGTAGMMATSVIPGVENNTVVRNTVGTVGALLPSVFKTVAPMLGKKGEAVTNVMNLGDSMIPVMSDLEGWNWLKQQWPSLISKIGSGSSIGDKTTELKGLNEGLKNLFKDSGEKEKAKQSLLGLATSSTGLTANLAKLGIAGAGVATYALTSMALSAAFGKDSVYDFNTQIRNAKDGLSIFGTGLMNWWNKNDPNKTRDEQLQARVQSGQIEAASTMATDRMLAKADVKSTGESDLDQILGVKSVTAEYNGTSNVEEAIRKEKANKPGGSSVRLAALNSSEYVLNKSQMTDLVSQKTSNSVSNVSSSKSLTVGSINLNINDTNNISSDTFRDMVSTAIDDLYSNMSSNYA